MAGCLDYVSQSNHGDAGCLAGLDPEFFHQKPCNSWPAHWQRPSDEDEDQPVEVLAYATP